MNNRLFKTLLALLVSCLFLTSVAFASPPTGDTGGDTTGGDTTGGDTTGGEPPVTDDFGQELNDRDQQLADEAGAEAERVFDSDAHQSATGTVHLEMADREGTENPCRDLLGHDGNIGEYRRESVSGSWPGVDGYSFIVVTDPVTGADTCEVDEREYYKRVNSCFDPETKILMGDKSYKAIKDVRRGDLVWNPVLNKSQKVHKLLVGPEKVPMIEVGFADTRMKITQTHPMVVRRSEAGIKKIALGQTGDQKSTVVKANELRLGDQILGADGEFHKIETLQELPIDPAQVVYNFELEADSDEITKHMIVAEGFITGDVRVQANLNNYTLPWDKE